MTNGVLSLSRFLSVMLDGPFYVTHNFVHAEFSGLVKFELYDLVLAPAV